MKVPVLLSISVLLFISIISSSCGNDTRSLKKTPVNKKTTIQLIKSNVNKEKAYVLDYDGAYQNGFVMPSINHKIDSFKLSLKIENDSLDELYYKIYYQNESYKFEEEFDNPYEMMSSENFYGSWENVEKTFVKIGKEKSININSSFRITGNPRSEKVFYSLNSHQLSPPENEITNTINGIKENSAWLKAIEEKAIANKVGVDDQLRVDAIYILTGEVNNRWKRNLRVGTYSVLVVVANKKELDSIPNYIKNISLQKKGEYVSPYYYFLHGDGKDNSNINTLLIEDFASVKAEVPLTNGIYVDFDSIPNADKRSFNKLVNNSSNLFTKAAFEYHFSHQANTESFMNIAQHADFKNEGYSHEKHKDDTLNSERIKTYFTNTVSPGKTFGVDLQEKALWFKNPGNKAGEFKKENVGLKTRHGLTYGKYTFKIKMPKLLTKENIWTGVTNAIWLIYEKGDWNIRRICNNGGYMPFYGAGEGEQRVPQVNYSEIDFEILKTVESWPASSYGDQLERIDPKSHENKVMVTCTNWDMACQEPRHFSRGLNRLIYKTDTFNFHRWDQYYNAVTSKYPEEDDVLFGGEFYYFQIEWSPRKIIWRIGPEKEKLYMVGYMNEQMTTIPNNQMLAVLTQEYHFSEWWPNSPYKQENIPFSSKDLLGKLYSLEIE
jgi:hypothetical protein